MTHIMVWRGDLPEDSLQGFWHHGIQCPDGSVIHYTGMDGVKTLTNAQILRTDIQTFISNPQRELHYVTYQPTQQIYSVNEIVRRAESRIGERGYNLLNHNCENFARWCVIGRSQSYQSQGAIIGIVAGTASFIFGAGFLGAALTALVAQRTWDQNGNPSGTRQTSNRRNDGYDTDDTSID